MKVEVNGELEKLIQAHLASGGRRSVEELLGAMAALWAQSQTGALESSPLPVMGLAIDIDAAAATQGVLPCHDPAELRGAGWPSADTVEQFDLFLQKLRTSSPVGGPG